MSSLNRTPSGERLRITIFGRRNAGKSSLINALTGQRLAIVSDHPGTTTDPVSKAMELLPLGPVVLTDTAGLDDLGDLGELRVAQSLRMLEKSDVVILVVEVGQTPGEWEEKIADMAVERKTPMLVVANKVDRQGAVEPISQWASHKGVPYLAVAATTGHQVEELKGLIIKTAPAGNKDVSLVGDLVAPGDVVILVVPIDKAAPKGRLILPQVMTLRDLLDNDACAVVVKERELRSVLGNLNRKPKLVITDSQAFLKVAADVPTDVLLTGFSVLLARYRGDLERFVAGAKAINSLKVGSRVLISEGCTHHRQADDIGTVQIPRWLRQRVGGELHFGFSSGVEFPPDVDSYDLIIHCGACTLNRKEVLYRQRLAQAKGVPMTNYGIVLALLHGILDRALEPFPLAAQFWKGEHDFMPPKPPKRVRTLSHS